jgi:DNA-binding MarR family transcriptional regulator
MEQAKRTQAALDAQADEAAGLTYNQSQVLTLVGQSEEGAMVSKLAPVLDRAVHTLTVAVTGLEKKGLLQRLTIKGEDARIVRIKLTADGVDAVSKLRATTLPLP